MNRIGTSYQTKKSRSCNAIRTSTAALRQFPEFRDPRASRGRGSSSGPDGTPKSATGLSGHGGPRRGNGVGEGRGNRRLAKRVQNTFRALEPVGTPLGVQKCHIPLPEVETSISRPRGLPCTTPSISRPSGLPCTTTVHATVHRDMLVLS